jgi:5'-nucleotidase
MSNPARSALATVLGATALVAGASLAVPASAAPVEVQVIGINDVHGHLEALDDNGTDDPGDDTGGAAMLAGAVARMRSEVPNTVVVSAGDNVGATPFVSAVADDQPTLDALEALGLQVSASGNHEFDRGYGWLSDPRTHGVDGAGQATWPTLGANVEGETPEMPASFVVPVGTGADAVDVGFVGLVTQQTGSLVSPDGIRGITFTDPVAAANRAAARLTGSGQADVVVLLVHEGSSSTDCARVAGDGAFGRIVTEASADIVAIISGHTHTQYACMLPAPGGGTRPVVQTGQYGEAFDRVRFSYDGRTREVSGLSAEVRPTAGFAPDPAVAGLVAAAVDEAAVAGEREVGAIAADLPRAFAGGQEDRGAESVLGNFVADVHRAATAPAELGGARLALMNPGGLRADLCMAAGVTECQQPTQGDGVVTYADAAEVQPFANTLVTMTLTGAQVRQVLEEQWQPPGSSRPFLALGVSSGFFFTYDPDGPAGRRVVDITLDGEPVDPAGQYRVTVNSFLAAGGDNFTTLADGTQRQDNGFNDLDVLVDYLASQSPVTADTAPRRQVAEAGAPTSTPTSAPSPGTPGDSAADEGAGAGRGQVVAAAVLAAALVVALLAGLVRRRGAGGVGPAT